MASESKDQWSPAAPVKGVDVPHNRSKISYAREFLLSFSELETCKRMPSGFDPSILSEFQEASQSIPEWRRIPGSSSLPKRGEPGSAPTRVDYTREGHDRNAWQGSGCGLGHGKWDSRFGLNERDGDQYCDRESSSQDSGRRYGHQSRFSWQSTEHDGLLGSGDFPRPSGNTGGALSSKVRSAQYHLNRSTEPYHPPRPYKVGNYSRRDATDSCNDETFGSTECSSQDRVEEERMRRASFELMRKEQQKTLQEKQKHIPDKQSEQLGLDLAANLEKSEDEKSLQSQSSWRSEDLALQVSQNDHTKCVLPAQAPAARPLVPPGFGSNILEKNLGAKPLVSSSAPEDGKSLESNLNTNATAIDSATEVESDLSPFLGPIEQTVIPLLSDLKMSNSAVGSEIPNEKKSGLLDANEVWVDGTVAVEEEPSTSILEKLFGNALTVNDGGFPGFIEHQSILADEDKWHPIQSCSSKFAHWFLEEEKKPADYDQSSSKANNLLSLFVNNEKGASHVSSVSEKGVENILPTFPVENKQIPQKLITTDATSATVGVTEAFHHSDKPGMRLGVLTCEDLEESILAEVKETSLNLQHSLQGPWSALEVKADQQKVDVDDRASQHLLSLLHKGSGPRDQAPSVNDQEIGPSGGVGVGDVRSIGEVGPSASGMKADTIQNPEQVLTLETLFGTAFMKELQSVEAPLSAQRGLVGGVVRTDALDPLGLPFPAVNDSLPLLGAGESGSSRTIREGLDTTASVRIWEENSEKICGNWRGFDDSETKGSKLAVALGFEVNRPDRAVETRLPEEESLISVGEPTNMEISKFVMPVGLAPKPKDFLSSNTQVEMTDKLAVLNAILKEEKPIRPGMDCQSSLPRDPYTPVESEFLYQNLLGRPSPKLPHYAMNQSRHMYQHPEHHPIRNQLKFMGQESLQHEPHHPFPPNIVHHPFHNSAVPRFGPSHHSLLQQQHFPVPNNLPPPHLLQALPRGMQLSHTINHVGGYAPELLNPMQGFPFNHRPPNYGGLGMALPGSGGGGGGGGGGGNRPEALERLIEMELRSNSNKKLAAASGINGPHELDIPGFRYR